MGHHAPRRTRTDLVVCEHQIVPQDCPYCELARLRAQLATLDRCKCGVSTSVSHYCSALGHCWVSADKATPPNPYGEHLAPNGKPIDGYPLQQA
jgi:hypothetical protein